MNNYFEIMIKLPTHFEIIEKIEKKEFRQFRRDIINYISFKIRQFKVRQFNEIKEIKINWYEKGGIREGVEYGYMFIIDALLETDILPFCPSRYRDKIKHFYHKADRCFCQVEIK